MQESSERRQRLPVNPRRHKVTPENRKRVAKACNSCNVRRTKCSGGQPCQQCRMGSRACVYPPEPPLKGKSLKEELERLQRKCERLEKYLAAVLPDNAARDDLLRNLDGANTTTNASMHSASSSIDDTGAAEGRMLFDPDGNARFLGETSGATFLDLVKAFMWTLVSLAFVPAPGATEPEDGSAFMGSCGGYQTFDSRPLLDLDVDPFWFPTHREMTLMLAELRYHIQDGNGDFDSGGIYYWGNMSSIPKAITLTISPSEAAVSDRYRDLAFYHVSFAVAAQILNQSLHQGEIHAGDAFFKRARMLLGNPLDTVRFTMKDVPVLALMAFYLIEINRRDAAYLYTSLAIQIAVTHGASRHCEDEASKRIFWNVYVLDRWLSCMMGRPPTLMDEAIRISLPIDVPNMPPSTGLRAHIQLARISGFIVCETFKVAPRILSNNSPLLDIKKPMKMLQDWLLRLPESLQMTSDQPKADAACCILHMAHNQLIVITTRPVLLTAVKRFVAERCVKAVPWNLEQQPEFEYIRECTKAAHSNINLARWVLQLYNTKRLLQAGLHFVFNAAVMLLLNRVLHNQRCASEEIKFAIDLFNQQSQTGTNYERDCLQVLKDLSVLVDQFLSSIYTVQQTHDSDVPDESQICLNVTNGHQAHAGHGRQVALNDVGNVSQELLQNWLQNSESQLYGSFRI